MSTYCRTCGEDHDNVMHCDACRKAMERAVGVPRFKSKGKVDIDSETGVITPIIIGCGAGQTDKQRIAELEKDWRDVNEFRKQRDEALELCRISNGLLDDLTAKQDVLKRLVNESAEVLQSNPTQKEYYALIEKLITTSRESHTTKSPTTKGVN